MSGFTNKSQKNKVKPLLKNHSYFHFLCTRYMSDRLDMVGTIYTLNTLKAYTYQWVNSASIFFWYELLLCLRIFKKIKILKVNYFHLSRKKYLKSKSWCDFNAIFFSTSVQVIFVVDTVVRYYCICYENYQTDVIFIKLKIYGNF